MAHQQQRRREDESETPIREKSVGVTWGVFATVVIPLASMLVLAGINFGGISAKAEDHDRRLTRLESTDSAVGPALATLSADVRALAQRITDMQQQLPHR